MIWRQTDSTSARSTRPTPWGGSGSGRSTTSSRATPIAGPPPTSVGRWRSTGPVRPRPRAVIEADFLALIRARGLPEPERQVVIDLEDGERPIRVDFMWRAAKVVIETDGHQYHGTRHAFERDRRRDQRLARAGWRCVRITWRQLTEDPESVAVLLADLLAG